MWLGGDGSPSNAVYTPLAPISNNNPYYAINVNSMFLGETIIAENASNTFAQPVLDTGTSLFYVPTSVYTTFVSALEASVGFQTIFGSNRFATGGPEQGCVTDVSVTSEQVEAYLPSIILSLPNVLVGHADVAIQASALDTYIYSNGGGQYCLAIQDGGTQDPSTFGDAFLQGFHTIIDIDNSRVGFAKTRCAPPTLRQFNKNRVHSSPHRGPHRNPRTRGSR